VCCAAPAICRPPKAIDLCRGFDPRFVFCSVSIILTHLIKIVDSMLCGIFFSAVFALIEMAVSHFLMFVELI